MNLPTVIIGLLIFGLFIAIVIGEVRGRRKGGGCGCSCQGCPSAGVCHGGGRDASPTGEDVVPK